MTSIFESQKKFNKSNFFVYLSKRNKIVPLDHFSIIELEDLQEISDQKEVILNNTLCFLNDIPSSNILLWGAKGMGKSTLVKCLVNHINKKNKKIKLVEVLNNDVEYIAEIAYELSKEKSKFIIFIDDISFKNNDQNFKLFKSLIEGSLLSHIKNIKYYITSNLRHLSHRKEEGSNDIEIKEANQNLISLSDRFGCWVGFYDSNQEQYLKMVKYYLNKYSIKLTNEIEKNALRWSLQKGNFSGRTAFQFTNQIKR